ncbi:histidinol phosphate phosphatase domain-containing protein [Brevibacillus sp. DP1.3A]|uniref:histidinol phosphate phosphatase domain-containing protein n=1 Tax=Brevibacillus sp. DP1.3A TaxID=2738867 RepID=UPI00156AFD62|nr:histidinol phosphate phosphatase domain-containing protein [Brevibacillus sp. DP1.3A]UED74997.1 histidinol phosphate phosphatase domain-containing protein [Brevibacillus sp. DP1.3A]
MLIDYHLHLEEGPFSLRWLDRTNVALDHFYPLSEPRHTRAWLLDSLARLNNRMSLGAYDPSWIDLYLREALNKGLKEVGIVDHLYRFREARPYFERYMELGDTDLGRLQRTWLDQVCTESLSDFCVAIEAAKQRWSASGVELRLGIEADYFIGGEAELESLLAGASWDYVIGSVHFLQGWGFDNPETRHLFEQHDLKQLYADFFHTVESMIRSNLFDFVAHLDNLKVFSYRPEESELVPYYHRIATALTETDTATEINAGLYYRYPVQEMCPSPAFLDVLVAHGVPLTLSSDAHFPDDIGRYVAANLEILHSMGVTEIATFSGRQRIMKPIRYASAIPDESC